MPLRTPKPYYRIQKKSDRVTVSYFSARNMRLIPQGSVDLPNDDPKGFKEELDVYVKKQTGESQT